MVSTYSMAKSACSCWPSPTRVVAVMRRDYEALRDGLKKELQLQGYPLDVDDEGLDFIIGVIQSECARLNVIVTGRGVANLGDADGLS